MDSRKKKGNDPCQDPNNRRKRWISDQPQQVVAKLSGFI